MWEEKCQKSIIHILRDKEDFISMKREQRAIKRTEMSIKVQELK